MASSLTIAHGALARHRGNRVTVRSRTIPRVAHNVGLTKARKARVALAETSWFKLLGIVLVAANLVMLGLHVVNANKYAVKGYEVTKIREQISDLTEQNKKLTMKMSESVSIAEVQQSAMRSNFVPVTSVEFIKPPSTQVSRR